LGKWSPLLLTHCERENQKEEEEDECVNAKDRSHLFFFNFVLLKKQIKFKCFLGTLDSSPISRSLRAMLLLCAALHYTILVVIYLLEKQCNMQNWKKKIFLKVNNNKLYKKLYSQL